VLGDAFTRAGFREVTVETVSAPLHMTSAKEYVRFAQESFGALHQMLSSLDAAGRDAAWAEVATEVERFEDGGGRFVGPCELLVAVGTK
jgi:hypothetical protein